MMKVPKEKFLEIQKFYDLGATWKQVCREFQINFTILSEAKKLGLFSSRTISESLKIHLKNNPQKHSEETKKKISLSRKKFLKENPEKVPYLLNHYSKGDSYPEKYFVECLKETSFIKKFRVGTYELDFALLKEKIDLEIDGEQHFVDPRIVEHDKKRNKILSELGWTIVRVRWSKFKKLSLSQKEDIVKSIKINNPIYNDCIIIIEKAV